MIVPHPAPLPLIPHDLLRRHHALEPSDDRFRANARLLQSLWRDAQGLPAGHHQTRRGGKRKLGSRLTNEDAAIGRNFLSPALARLAQHELVYAERGALIERRRFLGNTLSSQPLAINLFGPARLDATLATHLFQKLLPGVDIAAVEHVGFETSPGRHQSAYTNDATAHDVGVVYRRSDGARGYLAFELKYSETAGNAASGDIAQFDDLSEASGLHRVPVADLLQRSALRQVTREHLLAQSMIMSGMVTEATFIVVAPRQNFNIVGAANRYTSALSPALNGMAAFAFIDLETVIGAYREIGEDNHAYALRDRYVAFEKIDRLIDAELAADQPTWQIQLPANDRLIALPTAA